MCIHYSEACQSTIAVGSLRLQLLRWTFSRQTVSRRADTRGSKFEEQLEFHVHVCSRVTTSCVSNSVTCRRDPLLHSLKREFITATDEAGYGGVYVFRAVCLFVCLSVGRIIKIGLTLAYI